ncbi:hypothetical protein FHS78_001039 [Parvibaculum indicum]|uniref:hypothetical protein n=1 Tax=Parvibaculum indicum TaxID=562969 RepID=UPI00141DFA58|nr:hypothetical protein [Parvibaculum indicum]NIJ40763.1 hypothetical protein [Parvibaculum indicum]
MIVVRVIGLVLIIVALMALGSDALRSLEAGEVVIRSTSELWTLLNPGSHDAFMGWATDGTAEGAAGPIETVMSYPAWAVIGVLGVVVAAIAALLGRKD